MIKNPRYRIENQEKRKEEGKGIAIQKDVRESYVAIECGVCCECTKKRKTEWQVRLTEEEKNKIAKGWMVTLTFNDEHIADLEHEIQKTTGKEASDNEIVKLAVKRFRERWRQEYKTSIRHWFVTEHGSKGTERIHIHGIIWTDINITEGLNRSNRNKINWESTLARKWKYGGVHIGKWCNLRTVNYIVKYITKGRNKWQYYKPITLVSPGIGREYVNEDSRKRHEYKENETKTWYHTDSGKNVNLSTYYKRKLWNEEERLKIWMNYLDKEIIYIFGQEYSVRYTIGQGVGVPTKDTTKRLIWARKRNEEMGYPNGYKWKRKEYGATKNSILSLINLKTENYDKENFNRGSESDHHCLGSNPWNDCSGWMQQHDKSTTNHHPKTRHNNYEDGNQGEYQKGIEYTSLATWYELRAFRRKIKEKYELTPF